MRGKKQMAKRVQRATIANELLVWLKEQGITGAYLSYPYVGEFIKSKGHDVFEVWKAWDLLKEAGRLSPDHRHGWKVLDFTPIALDDNGDLEKVE